MWYFHGLRNAREYMYRKWAIHNSRFRSFSLSLELRARPIEAPYAMARAWNGLIKCQNYYIHVDWETGPCRTMVIDACVTCTLRSTHEISTIEKCVRQMRGHFWPQWNDNHQRLNETISAKCLPIDRPVCVCLRISTEIIMMRDRTITTARVLSRTMKSENYNSSRTITIRRCFSYEFRIHSAYAVIIL